MFAPALTHLLSLVLLLGLVADGWLGIYLADTEHPQVAQVIEGSPAQRAGLQAGDRLLAVDGAATASRGAFTEAIRQCKPGQRVRLKLMRDGKELTVLAQLGERPAALPPVAGGTAGSDVIPPPAPAQQPQPARPAPRQAFLGVELRETGDGVVIVRVLDGSPAAQAGLRDGDHLVRLGDTDIRRLDEVQRTLAERRVGDRIAVQVRSASGTRSVWVELAAAPGSRGAVAVAPPPGPAPAPAPPGPDLVIRAPDAGEPDLAAIRAELQEIRAQLREIRRLLEQTRRNR